MKITESDFDWLGSQIAKHRAIDQVEQSHEKWGVTAMAAVMDWLQLQPEGATFITADLYHLVDRPREPRAWGALMRALSRLKLCQKTDRTKDSNLKHNHGRPMAIWRKL
jgi:hypothetical protein